jgi:hypothetical protein
MDNLLENEVYSGKLTEKKARDYQQKLVDVGMTLGDAKENPDEFISRTKQVVKRKDQIKEDQSSWDMWVKGLDAGWFSQFVGGAVDGLNQISTFLEESVQSGTSYDRAWRTALAVHYLGFGNREVFEKLDTNFGWSDMGFTGSNFMNSPEGLGEFPKGNIIGTTGALYKASQASKEPATGFELATTPKEEGFVPGAIRGISQFVTGQVAVNALAGPVGGSMSLKRSLAEGGVTAATAFDPDDSGNFADLLLAMGWDQDDSIVQWLATEDKEEESRYEKRIKNGLMDMGLGKVVHSVMGGLKGIKKAIMSGTENKLVPKAQASELSDENVTALQRPKRDKPDEPVIAETVEEQADRTAQQIDEVRPETLVTIDEQAFDDFLYIRENIPDEQLTSEAGNPVPWWDDAKEIRNQVRRDGGITITWDYIKTTDDVKQAATQLEVALYERLQKAKGKKTWAETEELAKRLNILPEHLQRLPGRIDQITEEIYAGRLMQVSAFERLLDLTKVYEKSKNPENLQALLRHFSVYSAMTEWLAGGTSGAGRLLNSLKMPVASDAASIAKLDAYIQSYGGNAGIDSLMALVKRIELDRKHGPAGRWLDVMGAWAKEFGRGLNWTKELIVDTAVQGMISSTITIGRNLAGNTYMVADKLARTLFSEVVSPVVGGPVEKYETAQMLYGMYKYLPDALLRSTVALITDKPQTKLFRNEFYKSSLEGNLNVGGDMLISDGLRFLNKSIYLPGRVNMTQDEFFRSINIGMEKQRLAHRYAMQASREGILPYKQAMNDILSQNPDSPMRHHYADISKRTMSEAADQIFATPVGTKQTWGVFDWGGKQLWERINEWRNEPTGLGKLVIPFYGTVLNLDRQALMRIPGANVLVKESVDNILGKAGREAQIDAVGKLFVGTSIAMGAWEMMETGEMTASYPPQRAADEDPIQNPYFTPSRKYLQDSSWRPYALVSEEGYRSLRGLDPVALMMQFGADAWVMHKIMTDANLGGGLFRSDNESVDATEAWLEMAKYFTLAAGTKIDERPFMQGISDTLALLQEDDLRHKAVVSNLLSSVNPLSSYYGALRAAWARSEDAYQRDSKAHNAIDQAVLNWQRRNGWLTDFTGSGGSMGLNPRVNFVGDPQLIYATQHWMDVEVSRKVNAFLNVASVSPVDKHPLMERIRELGGVRTEFPSRWVSIQVPAEDGTKREDISQEQQYAWVMQAAEYNRASFKKLFNPKGTQLGSPLDQLPAQQQRDIIDGLLSKNKIVALEKVFYNDPLWKDLREKYPNMIRKKALGKMSDKLPAAYYNTKYQGQESKTTKGSNTNPVLEQISE